MAMKSDRWQTITPSEYPWEQHGLDYLRSGLPDRDPYQVWANFEFQAGNGALYEVDALVLTRSGLFLVELKHRTGTLRGDAGTWTRTTAESRLHSEDNPYPLANRKAKALAGLLSAQPALRRERLPFLVALVFVYSTGDELKCKLHGPGKAHICLKDELEPNKAGILAALKSGFFPGATRRTTRVETRLARRLAHAMDEAGIRRTQRFRQVGDYVLDQLLFEGTDFQDRKAHHSAIPNLERRVRLYMLEQASTPEQRQRLKRAALREFQLLQGLAHPGVIAVHDYKEHELGPALIFDYDKDATRLDHFLIARKESLPFPQRLHMVRQLAEAMQYMHSRRIVHRGLSPESILVTVPDADRLQLKIFNWQTGSREGATSGTTHVQDLLERQSMVYLAPEAINTARESGELCDIYSLGAVAFRIFAGKAPATDHVELYARLSRDRGLRLSSVVDGSPESLEALIQRSTHPDPFSRIDTIQDFLERLDLVEQDLVAPENLALADPLSPDARPGDLLGHGYLFVRRLGQGSSAVALLAEKEDRQVVLKIAQSPDNNDRLAVEGEALRTLRHPYIVELLEVLELGGRTTLVLSKAGDRTLAARLREDGPLSVDLLQRFGEDLLSAVQNLEERGIAHRDIKPENLGVTAVGRGDALHLVLYDFSLTRASAEQLLVGTRAYRDPFLPLRDPPAWDWNAERYSTAVTLFEMATASLPIWGTGNEDPALVDCSLQLHEALFDPPELRQPLLAFFRRGLHRDPRQRFDNAEEMRRCWSRIFDDLDEGRTVGIEADGAAPLNLEAALVTATLDTWVAELGLSTRSRNALERAGVLTVKQFLETPSSELPFMRGVGKKTRDELLLVSRLLRKQFPQVTLAPPKPPSRGDSDGIDMGALSVDTLAELVVGPVPKGARKKTWLNRRHYLGLEEPVASDDSLTRSRRVPAWPTQNALAQRLGVTRAAISAQIGRDRAAWRRLPALNALREQLVEMVQGFGGVMTAEELCLAALAARGSIQTDPLRQRQIAEAVTRAALESEQASPEPRLQLRRPVGRLLVVRQAGLDDYALRLGEEADKLAGMEPLPSTTRVFEVLQAVPAPPEVCLREDRLVRLAAEVSEHAAVSGRLELYPRGMRPEQSLRLAPGTLVGVDLLTPQLLHERILGRYPEAAPLPERPTLDTLLEQAGLSLTWDPSAGDDGRGAWRRPPRPGLTYSTRVDPHGSGSGSETGAPRTPDGRQAALQAFEAQLTRARQDGGFMVLTVKPRDLYQAEAALQRRFALRRLCLDALFIEALKQAAAASDVDWSVVLEADAAPPGSYDWEQLQGVVSEVLPGIEQQLRASTDPVLLVDAGLLARYDRVDVLERLRDAAGRPNQLPLCWLLVPTDEQLARPTLNQAVIPLLNPAQWARVPGAWVEAC